MKSNKEMVSYVAFEGEMTRLERIIKRLWIICLILILTLVATNLFWIVYDKQVERLPVAEVKD